MRFLLVLITAALLSIGACACGGASKAGGPAPHSSSSTTTATTVTSAATATPSYAKADSDKDNDIGAPYDDTNNISALPPGRPMNAADQRAVTALVKHYYTTAYAGEGAKACTMILSSLAAAIGEDYGNSSAGPSYLSSGKTCPVVMTLLFKHFHSQLGVELSKLEVTGGRLNKHKVPGEHSGLALLSFGKMPERMIGIAREGSAWKIDALLDTELP